MSSRGPVRRRISAWFDSILHWDRRLGHSIGNSEKLRRFGRMFLTATYLGDGYLWAALAIGLLAFGGSVGRKYVLIGFSITAVNILVFRTIKSLTSRDRPPFSVMKLRSKMVEGYSFPSGHATTSFGMAWVVSNCYLYTAVQVTVYLVAATIAFSRVYLREHYPLDVLGGAILGSAIAASLFPLLVGLVF